MTTGIPEWTQRAEKRGLDPLGMQTTSIALYQQLMPGIGNVTLRMRYYGLYTWLSHSYAKHTGDVSPNAWRGYLRRAEALYALVTALEGGEKVAAASTADAAYELGVAGVTWAIGAVATFPDGELDFSENCDLDSGAPQYLAQKFGAFGAAYGAQLVEVGLLQYLEKHSIPVPTPDSGDTLALAFDAAIGDAAPLFLSVAAKARVTKSELRTLQQMLPSRIDHAGEERRLYEELLLGASLKVSPKANARRLSLRLVLRVAQAVGRVDANAVRWALYSSHDAAGASLPPLPADESAQRDAWGAYQANDLLHVCYEALLKYSLDVLGLAPNGMPMDRLMGRVVTALHAALGGHETWEELVASIDLSENAWSTSQGVSEFALHKAVLKMADPLAVTTSTSAAGAVRLLAVLYKRYGSLVPQVAAQLPVIAEKTHIQSIVTELTYLSQNATIPLADFLGQLVKRRVMERHLWVAIHKFRGQGDYTFLIEGDEGRVRLRRKDGPALTNPRLASAITFLQDIHLLSPTAPTPAGLKVLEAA